MSLLDRTNYTVALFVIVICTMLLSCSSDDSISCNSENFFEGGWEVTEFVQDFRRFGEEEGERFDTTYYVLNFEPEGAGSRIEPDMSLTWSYNELNERLFVGFFIERDVNRWGYEENVIHNHYVERFSCDDNRFNTYSQQIRFVRPENSDPEFKTVNVRWECKRTN